MKSIALDEKRTFSRGFLDSVGMLQEPGGRSESSP